VHGEKAERTRIAGFRICAILWVCFLVACTAELPAPVDVLSAADAVSGWQAEGDHAIYDPDTLFDFMNGAADLYLTYGFEELAVGQYTNAVGTALQVEVYRVTTDADAYGLFAYNSYGEPTDVGVDGELDGGARLAFWQDRTFVQIVARNEVDNAALRAFGAAVALALPKGGDRPSLVKALPAEGMQPGSARFFRQKMALDNLLWLGPEDMLGLGTDTEGVLAHYEIDGQGMDLMLVAFPDAPRAEAAHSGLRGTGLENLVAADVKGSTLGAVFCPVDKGQAKELLDKAMTALR